MYWAGASDADLRESTGIPKLNVYRMIADQWLMQHLDGTLIGWRGAALPFYRVTNYRRSSAASIRANSKGGVVGSLRLSAAPKLTQVFDLFYLNFRQRTNKVTHKEMLGRIRRTHLRDNLGG